ncbi:MAG TPA: ATP-binding protein, partial [Nakamurella sp.]
HPGPVPGDVTHALRRVQSESARMTVLVDDLLLLARLDAGRPLAHDPVDLSRLAIDAISDARAAGPDHRWSLDLPEDPVVVPGDEHRLHQVLANLLTNARTHTPAGSEVTVAVAVRRQAEANGAIAELTVSDTGPGIPAGLRPRIFERFTRGDSARSRAAGSTGLGLAIVAAVTNAHGGTVETTREDGHTVFRVLLPG